MKNSLEVRRRQTELVLSLVRIRRENDRQVSELLEAEGLEVTAAQANALMVVFQAKEPLTARALADGLGVSEVTVSRFVKALTAGGWVQRVPDPNDARARLLVPTDKARASLRRFIRVSNAILDRAFSGFDNKELEALADAVERVHGNLVDAGR